MNGLPDRVGRLFHRYRWENLRVEDHAEVIIPTVLQWGDWADWRWLFRTYGWERVTDWVRHDAATYQSLPDAVQVFWTAVLLGQPVYQPSDLIGRWGPRRTVPEDEVPGWLREALDARQG